MDNGQTTTRKDFFKKSGLAIAGLAGAFAIGKSASSASTKSAVSGSRPTKDASVDELAARRVKPANGTVRYQS